MNDATRFRIRRELAERMSIPQDKWPYKCLVLQHPNDECEWCYKCEKPITEITPPDPFTNHADCAALVEWLAEQTMYIQELFHGALVARIAQYGMVH